MTTFINNAEKASKRKIEASQKFIRLYKEKKDYKAFLASFPIEERRFIFYLVSCDVANCGIHWETRKEINDILPPHAFKPGDYVIAESSPQFQSIIELIDTANIDRDEGADVLDWHQFPVFSYDSGKHFGSYRADSVYSATRRLTFEQFQKLLNNIEV